MTSTLYDIEFQTAEGETTTLDAYRDKVVLVVNVASKCGLTPQYADLQELQRSYADRGFSVVGFPCNQFNGQEPGTDAEIQEFCSTTFGVDFPVFSKIEVNGEGRHPLYSELAEAQDAAGEAGDVQWNFEKFLIAPGGTVVSRLRPRTAPSDPEFVALIEENLPA
ncbi:glutathione peroxidase [Subtercola endophyticus]|uniref:glutathione peroxidase n=1 Tax=Subtercola endophyticus TaxID=2895559 RepID=UPI001E5F2F72|nr:glutathione peroxidase [Subtercola endophyticus]UFS59410.1 glutathione peroxidase [Subtercola endophyticus]